MDIINLRERFGNRYRVTYEESYFAERGDGARVDDRWLQILHCRHGPIYPQGGDTLAVATSKRGAVANSLARLPCTTVVQDGDDGINATFHVKDFERVASLIKPRRRRQVSEKERERLANLGRKTLNRYRQANVGAPKNEQDSLNRDQPGLEAA